MNQFPVGPILPGRPAPVREIRNHASVSGQRSFQQLLNDQLRNNQQLNFSHHAEQRLKQRGIALTSEQLRKLDHAVNKASDKGAKDSLVLFQDMAFVVNVKNRTVITALDGAAMREHVFTKIDSTIIVGQ